jgi:hypothetical protein
LLDVMALFEVMANSRVSRNDFAHEIGFYRSQQERHNRRQRTGYGTA